MSMNEFGTSAEPADATDASTVSSNTSAEPISSDGSQLASIAGETVTQLAQLWDELGTPHQERQAIVKTLCENVARIYKEALQAEQQRRNDVHRHIVHALDDICTIAKELGEEASVSDDEELTLMERAEQLDSHLKKLEARKKTRVDEMRAAHDELQRLYTLLDVAQADRNAELIKFDDADLSRMRLDVYKAAIHACKANETERRAQIDELVESIRSLFQTLCEMPKNSSAFETATFEGTVASTLGLGARVIRQLESKRAELEALQAEREEKVKEYAQQITALWEQLQVCAEERDAFFECHQGLGPAVIQACADELARLQALKQERMKDLILDSRARVRALWDKLGFGDVQRAEFAAYYTDKFEEDVLEAHEREEATLEARYAQVQPILQMVEQREALKAEKVQFDLIAADPERLTSRKYPPGQLLKEERFRKMFNKRMPILNARICELLERYEKAHPNDGPFMYQGSAYLAEVRADMEKSALGTTRRRRLDMGVPSTAKTPVRGSTIASRAKTPTARDTVRGTRKAYDYPATGMRRNATMHVRPLGITGAASNVRGQARPALKGGSRPGTTPILPSHLRQM